MLQNSNTLCIETVTWNVVVNPVKLLVKLWPGLTIPPLLVTCAMLMMYKMSNTSFFTAPIHMWSLSAGLMCPFSCQRLQQCVCFSWPGKYQALFLPSCTISFLWAGQQSHFLRPFLETTTPCHPFNYTLPASYIEHALINTVMRSASQAPRHSSHSRYLAEHVLTGKITKTLCWDHPHSFSLCALILLPKLSCLPAAGC